MFDDILKQILGSDIVKKVTESINENDILKKVKEGIGDNDYVQKIEDGLKGGDILEKIKSGASTAGKEATKVALECYQVMLAESTPTVDKVIIGAALAYQFMPNLMSRESFGPIISLLDNAVTLAIAFNRVKAHVTPEIEAKVNEQLVQWFPEEKTEEPTEGDPVAQEGSGEDATPNA